MGSARRAHPITDFMLPQPPRFAGCAGFTAAPLTQGGYCSEGKVH